MLHFTATLGALGLILFSFPSTGFSKEAVSPYEKLYNRETLHFYLFLNTRKGTEIVWMDAIVKELSVELTSLAKPAFTL